jgi:acetone carboxylase gamma subunit
MGKKGISFEEKRQRMMSIFKDDQSFFHYKDIEKISLKKGISFPSIKEVLDSLVGDDLVECEKIGTSIYYWSLPSKIYIAKKNKIEKNKQIIK